MILAASRTENGGTGGLAENTTAAETAATAQELSMPQETAFRQPIRDFKKTFEAALSANKKEFMRLNGGGKTPPVGFKRISLELPGPDGAVQVTGNKWKPLFGQMLEAFYMRSGKGFLRPAPRRQTGAEMPSRMWFQAKCSRAESARRTRSITSRLKQGISGLETGMALIFL